jgi:hypothetical protein
VSEPEPGRRALRSRSIRGTLGSTLLLLALAGPAAPFDHSAFDRILDEYVGEDGLVDYEAIRQEAVGPLDAYLDSLAVADPEGMRSEDRIAFWINAYNARTIRYIVDLPDLKLVSERFDLFDLPFPVAGVHYSLNDIEHRILRRQVNPKTGLGPIPGLSLETLDPRIHFALVCGAISCPRLRRSAYTAARLEEMLTTAAVEFANDAHQLSAVDDTLQISSIMQWYAGDFAGLGGVAAYLAELTDPTQRSDEAVIDRLLATGFDHASFHYDWTVNDRRNRP